MNRFLRAALPALALLAAVPGLPDPAGAAKTAVCRVCAVLHGEAGEEEVKASRTYQGREYGFCSEKCARAFDADPAAYVPPDLPRPAPAFALEDLSGRAHSNESLKGDVVLLDFWATWCAPCKKTMPELQALHERYRERGLTVLGVSIDEGGSARVRKFVGGRKFTYPIALDDPQRPAWEAFRVKAVPAAFLIDPEGRIVAQWNGSPPPGGELEEKVRALLGIAP